MLKQLTFLESQNHSIKLIACEKNARARLPFFLDYYRKLGVEEFYIVDNNSNDGSADYLQSQPDVAAFWTDDSYQEANAGRRWTDEIQDRYGAESWCLTVDLDEFLIYPFCEHVPLPDLCRYLEQHAFQGVLSIMLDFYPCGPLRDAHYEAGDSVFEVANCHDRADRYLVHEEVYFPYFNIRGGVRQRVFWSSWGTKSGPPQKKIPLIRHHEGFSYRYSTHGSTPLKLADFTAALGHFKFFADSEAYVRDELKGKDRKNPNDYLRYQKGLRKNDQLSSPQDSVSYEDSTELVNSGMLAVSASYARFVESCMDGSTDADAEQVKNQAVAFRKQKESETISLKDFNKVWPILCHIQGDSDLAPPHLTTKEEYDDALRYIAKARKNYSLALTFRLRRFLRKRKLISDKAMVETMGADYTLREQMKFLYESIWWDLSAPVRLVGRFYYWLKYRLH